MISKHIILVAGPSSSGVDQICGILEGQSDIELRRLAFGDSAWDDGAFRPLPPKLIILDLSDQAVQVLAEWTARFKTQRIPIIMIGPANDDTIMRRCMQAGARDYLKRPVQADDFIESVYQVLRAVVDSGEVVRGQLTTVINAKGGSGASFIACNLAHILAAQRSRKTALIDLDLQFGALPLMLDIKTRNSLFDVISAVDSLDPIALQGFMTQHASGLQVLSSMTEQLAFPYETSVDAVQRVLGIATQTFDHVIVDLPRQLDPLSEMVLKSADRVLVVMQQSFAHLRDAKRMLTLLHGYLAVPRERITFVINRYNEKSEITGDDVRKALHPMEPVTLPNDYDNVTNSLNLGRPLYDGARNTPITEALCMLAARIDGAEKPEAPQTIRKTLRGLFGREERS